MKNQANKSKVKFRIGFLFLLICALTASVSAQIKSPAIQRQEGKSPWLNLQDGRDLGSVYVGADGLKSAIERGAMRPLSLAANDFDVDGYPDLVSGYSDGDSSVLAFRKANREAFAPQDAQILENLRRSQFPEPFLPETNLVAIPVAPDFLVTGDFNKDSEPDIVVASRGGDVICFLAGIGGGKFAEPQLIKIDGSITTLNAGRLNVFDSFADLLVGTTGENPAVLLFAGERDIFAVAPKSFPLSAAPSAIVLSQLDDDAAIEAAIIADGKVLILQTGTGDLQTLELPFSAKSIAAGEFIRDREARNELAVLDESGTVHILARGTLDTRPFTETEMREMMARNGGRGRADAKVESLNLWSDETVSANDWKEAEMQYVSTLPGNANSTQPLVHCARITGNETDDLLVLDTNSNQLHILFKEPMTDTATRTAFTGEAKISTLDISDTPVFALPMRLNVMAQESLLILRNGATEPTAVMFAPEATFNVSKTADTNDGTCNADCSLREAVRAANAAAGADLITFTNVGGSPDLYTLTIAGANENAATTGDLDITGAITITGNGSGETIVQAGTSAGTGIDKVFSINPAFTTAFASSLSGMTIRFGRNPSSFATDGFGGGLDWDGSGTGTLSIANSVITQNTTADGDGGGLVFTNGAGANPVTTVTVTGSTISSNQPARVGAGNSPQGGGIFVGVFTSVNMTNCTITSNNNNGSGGLGEGGGYFSFAQTTESLELHACSVLSNQSPSHGGGVRSTQRTTIDQNSIFNDNTSGGQGGGLFHNQNNITSSSITKTIFTNNSAVTSGGAIRLGSSSVNNNVNISFSRFAGNAATVGSGLAVFNGNATAENNWWSCNSGPGNALCNRAAIEAGGTGTLDFNPWILLTHTYSPSPIVTGQSSILTASFLRNSAGGVLTTTDIAVLLGLPITFNNAVRGTLSAAQTTIQASGTATATFTANAVGAGSAATVVDNSTDAIASITINKANTTITMNSDTPDPTVTGQLYTVTFNLPTVVAPGAGTPTGTVTVSDGTNSCNANLPATSCMLTSFTAGAKNLTATYNGDANFNASPASASIPHTVNKANTTATITADTPDPTVIGQNYAVTANVTVNSPGAGTPTGNITIIDNDANICVIALPATSCNLPSLSVGTKSVFATYNSDANFNPSPMSAPVSHTINQASTTTTIVSDNPDPSLVGQNVLVSVSVAANAPGAGFPTTGNITVTDGVSSCTASVTVGQCTLAFPTLGNRTLTATFSSNTNFAGSTSAGEPHTVITCPDTVVTNLNDSGAGSLRQAIVDVCNGGNITFASGLNGTITLTSGQLSINKNLTINGPGAGVITVSGNNASRVIFTNGISNIININDLTIADGRATTEGGGIVNSATLTLNSVVVSNNTTTFISGGGIFSIGVLTAVNCTISNNSSSGEGGGIFISNQTSPGITDRITGTTFSGNTATMTGGGLIVVDGTTIVSSSTFIGNQAANGGGIANLDRLTVNSSIIESNLATNGGGIYNFGGTLTLNGTSVQNHTNAGNGGGIFNSGGASNMTITNASLITGNQAANGGGIKNTGFLTVTNSTISGNSATVAGGGINNNETVNLTGSTVSGNTALRGGGIFTDKSVTLTNSTMSGNQATGNAAGDGGGAIFNAGNIDGNATVTFLNATIAGNTSTLRGGGIRNVNIVRSKNTIFAQNTAPTAPDFDGGILSDGFNLIGNTSGSGGFIASDLQNVNPNLGALTDNGGATQTRALQTGSPAINAGTNTGAPNTDQRGLSRPMGATADIGAFEVNACGNSVVTNTNDSGVGSLRCAIAAAFNDGAVDFNLPNGSMIVLSSEILIDKPLSINGPSANQLTISGNGTTRVFNITSTVSIGGLTIANGQVGPGAGGGILNNGNLLVDGCAFTGNQAGSGGGLFNADGATATVSNSTFSGNSAGTGGAIFNAGTINTSGTLRLINSTVSGNTASIGGGIVVETTDITLISRTSIINATIAGNTATGGFGGGINGIAVIKNTIIATNTGNTRPDVSGTFASQGFNLIGNTTGGSGFIASDMQNVNALLEPLADNGGTTQTRALQMGSPAIDQGAAADVSFASLAPIDTDQRGMPRPVDNPMIANAAGGDGSDIGAFEVQAPVAEIGFEADIASRPDGDNVVRSDDIVQIRRFLNGSNTFNPSVNEFQRADSAPFASKGDGRILSDDVVQARRYQNGTNPLQMAGGPLAPISGGNPSIADELESKANTSEKLHRQLRIEGGTAIAGETVTVYIQVDAQGDEAEYGFVLNYDQRILSNPVIEDGTAGASISSCNTMPAGQISCSVGGFQNNNSASSDAGIGEIGSGNYQILLAVTFTIAEKAAAGETKLKLSNVNASSDLPELFKPTASAGMVTILMPIL